MSNTVRQEKYADRVKASWECLLADVCAWEKTFKKRQNGLMAFHAQQFGTFCKNAHDRLMAEYDQDLRKKIRPSTGSGRAVGETPISSPVRGEPVEPRCVSPVRLSDSNQFDSVIQFRRIRMRGRNKRLMIAIRIDDETMRLNLKMRHEKIFHRIRSSLR